MRFKICTGLGVGIGAIHRMRESKTETNHTNPIIDYAVPGVVIAGVLSGIRAIAPSLDSPRGTHIPKAIVFGTGMTGGLIAGAIAVYSGTLVGMAIVDVAKEYRNQLA